MNILEMNNLQRSLGGVAILKNISAQVKAGDVIALLGKNGAGKTTLLETLLGFAVPSYGTATLWGEPAAQITGDIKQRIGFVPQQNELLGSFNGKDHLELFKTHRRCWNETLVQALVTDWQIPMDLSISKMSVGQQQKLSILLAMAHEPELLVLDEPVASLDPIARRQFLQQLIDVAADQNRAVIFSTHIVSDVERVANKVWMLRDGVLAYEGELDSLKESVAKVHIVAAQPFAKDYRFTNAIRQRVNGEEAVVTFSKWSPELPQQLAKEFDANVSYELLGLEDIFLEMNDAA